MKDKQLTRKLDHALAAPMFWLSMFVLALFATLINLNELQTGGYIVKWCLILLAIVYPLFWLETAIHIYAKSRFLKQHIWFCLLPITRIGARDHETGQEIWLPKLKWREVNRPLERMLAKRFGIPMIVIALMVLPLIVTEFFYKEFIHSNDGWRMAMKIAEAFIWGAFTFEFILMLSVVKYPLGYAKKHWLDLAIILLPTMAFMRAMRLASIGRLNQLSRTARIFRLRGMGMRMWRAFVALEVIEMLLSRNPERRLEKLEMQLEDKEEEIDLLKKDIQRLKRRVEKKKASELAKLESTESETSDEPDEETEQQETTEKDAAADSKADSTDDQIASESDEVSQPLQTKPS